VLGAVFAVFAGSADANGHIIRGLVPAYIGGGIGEILGAITAFTFIRRGSLNPAKEKRARR
jgi:hypothetical protein